MQRRLLITLTTNIQTTNTFLINHETAYQQMLYCLYYAAYNNGHTPYQHVTDNCFHLRIIQHKCHKILCHIYLMQLYTVSQKNAPTLKRYIRIDFDDIWLKCSKYSRIEFACFSFCVGLLFINFSFFKPDIENSANFDAVSGKRAKFDKVRFFKTYT